MKKAFLLVGVATLCFAAAESLVPLRSLLEVEASINDRMHSNINDPYDVLGPARGTYIPGYGAVFTVHLNLVAGSPLNLSPFKQTISEAELIALHDKKAGKVEGLKDSMRSLMLGASKSLTALPAKEHVSMEAFLFDYRWENSRGLPRRITLTAEKQKLLEAANRHTTGADLAALFTEEEM